MCTTSSGLKHHLHHSTAHALACSIHYFAAQGLQIEGQHPNNHRNRRPTSSTQRHPSVAERCKATRGATTPACPGWDTSSLSKPVGAMPSALCRGILVSQIHDKALHTLPSYARHTVWPTMQYARHRMPHEKTTYGNKVRLHIINARSLLVSNYEASRLGPGAAIRDHERVSPSCLYARSIAELEI